MLKNLAKLVLSCILFTLIQHYFSPTNFGGHFTPYMTVVRSLVEYSLIFLIFSLPIILLGLLFAKIRKKSIFSYFNSTLIVGWVLALLSVWGGWYANKTLAESSKFKTQPNKVQSHKVKNNSLFKKDVVAVTLKQENPGITEDMLDKNSLAELDAWVRQSLISKTRSSLSNYGVDPDSKDIKYNVDSGYVIKSGRKLAMFKFSTSINGITSVNGVRVMGVKKDFLVWVSCFVESPDPVFVWSGVCGKEIEKELGISIGKKP